MIRLASLGRGYHLLDNLAVLRGVTTFSVVLTVLGASVSLILVFLLTRMGGLLGYFHAFGLDVFQSFQALAEINYLSEVGHGERIEVLTIHFLQPGFRNPVTKNVNEFIIGQ